MESSKDKTSSTSTPIPTVPMDDRNVDISDRKRGTLLGLAWGDVFGCPVEGWPAGRIKKVFGDYVELPNEYPEEELLKLSKAPKLRPLGLHSDDTQQCLALIQCVLSEGKDKWDSKRWVNWLTEGVNSSAFRGYGRNFSQSINKLKKKVPYKESGSPSAGLGAAMRVGPLGAVYSDMDALAVCIYESSLITHGHIIAASIAFAVAAAVHLLVQGNSVEDVRKCLPSLVSVQEKKYTLDETWKIETKDYHLVSETLRYFFEECAPLLHDRNEIRKRISEHAKPHLADGFNKAHVNQGFACLGGIHGLIMGLAPLIHPQHVLNEIVQLGYDTDSVAAIAGGILGARFGCSWIPTERLLDLKRLQTYGDCIVKRSNQGLENKSEFMEREAKWTAEEKAFQRAIKGKFQATRQRVDRPKREKRKERKKKKKELREKEEQNREKGQRMEVKEESKGDEDKGESEEEEVVSFMTQFAVLEDSS